jgi:hypothetical protein
LQKKSYFISLVNTPLAETCTWEKFIDWLEVVKKEEASKKAEEVARKVAFEAAVQDGDEGEKALKVSNDELGRINGARVAENNEMVMRYIKQEPPNGSGSTGDRKSLSSQQSWSISDDITTVADEDDEDEEGFEPPPVRAGLPSFFAQKPSPKNHYIYIYYGAKTDTNHRAHRLQKFPWVGNPFGIISITSIAL